MQQNIYSNFDRLRLPLILLVVFIHAQFSAPEMETSMSLYGAVSHFLTLEISQVAVPLFFFMSGCLYFRDYKEFSLALYYKKQKRRIRSLVIPYLTWNTFFWFLFSMFIMIVPTLVNGGIPNIANATVKDIVWVYWGNATGGPIDFPLWFVRDLIVVTIISPLIYFTVLRYKIGLLTIIALASLWFLGIPVPNLGNNICMCLFFFSLGSLINKMKLDKGTNKALLRGGGTFIGRKFCIFGSYFYN